MTRPGPCRLLFPVSLLLLLSGAAARRAAASPRVTTITVPAGPHDVAFRASGPQILYLNRRGGSYQPGANHAATNRTSIVAQTSHVPAWEVDDDDWNAIVDCVRGQFAPFAIQVTDRDPGEQPHIESVVAGRPTQVGLPSGVGGVAPFAEDCSVIPEAVVFTFAELYGSDYQLVCEVIAQEVAHAFGLDHEYDCRSNLSYLRRDPVTGDSCGKKSFLDVDVACGEFRTRDCACGRPAQNSFALLAERVGLVTGPENPVRITAPQDGQQVDPGFRIRVAAMPEAPVERMVLLIDGRPVAEDTEAPWEFTTDVSLADGAHRVEARAHRGGLASSDTITVVVEAEAPSALGCRLAWPGTGGAPGGAWLAGLALWAMSRGRWRRFAATLRRRAADR